MEKKTKTLIEKFEETLLDRYIKGRVSLETVIEEFSNNTPIKFAVQKNESGRSRLLQILNGTVPNIYTFGIITAENPLGSKLPTDQNKERNDNLELYLQKTNHGYFKIKGEYGVPENSFFVNNIRLNTLIKLAQKYGQESVIYAEKLYDSNNNPFVRYYFYAQNVTRDELDYSKYHGDGNFTVRGIVDLYLDKKDATMYFSKFQGKKFQIPFFDKEHDYLAVEHVKNIISENELELVQRIEQYKKELKESKKSNPKSVWQKKGLLKVSVHRLSKLTRGN